MILPLSLIPGSVIRCRPVGMLKMTDESDEDTKILAGAGRQGVQRLFAHPGAAVVIALAAVERVKSSPEKLNY